MSATTHASSHATPRPALAPGQLRPDAMHTTRPRRAINIDAAGLELRKAWLVYLILGALPPIAMVKTIFAMIFIGWDRAGHEVVPLLGRSGMVTFVLGMFWLSVTVPLGFFLRQRLWEAYEHGEVVKPANYLKGMLPIWIPLVIAGVFGFVAFAATRETSNIFTSATAFIVFLAMFPNGHAMTRPVGDHDDPGVYELPK